MNTSEFYCALPNSTQLGRVLLSYADIYQALHNSLDLHWSLSTSDIDQGVSSITTDPTPIDLNQAPPSLAQLSHAPRILFGFAEVH